ncbi:MAG: hypothetical protein WBL58_02855 [Peptococcia bacterium]
MSAYFVDVSVDELDEINGGAIIGGIAVCLAIGKYNFWQSKVQLPVPPYLLHQ